MPEGTISSGTHAAKGVGHEFANLVLDYLVPVGSGLAGFSVGPTIFGGNEIGTQILRTGGQMGITGATATRVGGAVMAGITAAIGYAFWHMGKRDGWIMKLAGKGFGAFFLGTAANYAIMQVLLAKGVPSGGIVTAFANGFQNLATGG